MFAIIECGGVLFILALCMAAFAGPLSSAFDPKKDDEEE